MSRSTESIAFANQLRREVNRLEKLHASNIAPGTTNWAGAFRIVFDNLEEVGSPIKQSAVLKNLFACVSSVDQEEEGIIFPLAYYNAKRTAGLSLVTIEFGQHPLTGPQESGVSVNKTTITVRRDGDACLSRAPLAYISKHAIERMHERRSHPLGIGRAMNMIASVGMLGAMICLDHGGHEALCLNVGDEVLAVGDIRHAVGVPDEYGRCSYTPMYDARSFLCIGELDSRDKLLAQGNAAVAAIQRWADHGYEDAGKFIREIPFLAQERESYTARTAEKVTRSMIDG